MRRLTAILSAFRGHLVLLWNDSGHTFVDGCHVVATVAMARALDIELDAHRRMLHPSRRADPAQADGAR
jgi:hypothetical protein